MSDNKTDTTILAVAFVLCALPASACTVGTPSPYHGAYIMSCGKNAEFSYMTDSQEHVLKVCQGSEGCEVKMNHLCYHVTDKDFNCQNPKDCTYGGKHIEPTCWDDQ
jgi:hypothetical protein